MRDLLARAENLKYIATFYAGKQISSWLAKAKSQTKMGKTVVLTLLHLAGESLRIEHSAPPCVRETAPFLSPEPWAFRARGLGEDGGDGTGPNPPAAEAHPDDFRAHAGKALLRAN